MEGLRAEKAKGGMGGRIPCVPRKAVVALFSAPWQQGTAGLPQNVSIHLTNKTPEQHLFVSCKTVNSISLENRR